MAGWPSKFSAHLLPICRTGSLRRSPLPAALVRVLTWLKGNAHEKSGPSHRRAPHPPDFSHGASAEFWGAYLIVIAAAAIVTMTHPKPELIPLLLWSAGHPL